MHESASHHKDLSLMQLISTVGAASVVFLFVAAISSWAFARGMLSSFGFPAKLVNFQSALGFFPNIAFDYTVAFFLVLGIGIIGERRNDKYSAHVLWVALMLLWIVVIVDSLSESLSAVFQAMSMLAALAAPFFLGYALRLVTLNRRVAPLVLLLGVAVLSVHSGNLYRIGMHEAKELASSASTKYPRSEMGMSAIKSSDLPVVSLWSKEKLPVDIAPQLIGDLYEYRSGNKVFFRLILEDDSNYYFVVNNQGAISTIATRKDDIRQLLFAEAH